MSVVANVALNLDTRGVPQKLRDIQGQAQQTERAFDSLGNTVGRLVKAYAAFQAVKFVFTQAAEVESQARSLQVLTGSAEKATQIIKQLQDLGAATPFTSSELIDAAKRLQAFGVATENVVETTRRLADVSGATGAELQGLVTAYGQVQAKGRLQGEELLQFQERGVALQKVLKEEYKLSGDQFQKALEKGQIGAASVEYAIKKLTDAGGKYANGAIAQSDTLNGKLSTLQDSFQRLAQNIGKFFEPVFKFLIDGVNALIERLNNAQRIGVEAQAYQEANVRTQNRFGRLRAANPFDTEVQQYRERLRKSLVTSGMGVAAAPAAPSVPAGALPSLLAPSGGKGGADKAAREAKRLAEELKRSLETGDQLGVEFSRQVVQLGTISETEKKRNEIQFQYEDRARQIGELKNAEQKINLAAINSEIRRLELQRLQTEEIQKQAKEFIDLIPIFTQFEESLGARAFKGGILGTGISQDTFRTDINLNQSGKPNAQMEAYKKQLNDLVAIENQVKVGAEAIGDAFGNAFSDLISGATSAEQAFANLMQSIADHFLNMATQIITQQITMIIYGTIMKALGLTGGFGFSGAGPVSGAQAFGAGGPSFNPAAFGGTQLFAEGGYVTGPTRAVVGEAGNEYVIPASKMRGAMNRYAAGARGSAVIPAGGGGDGGTATMAAAPATIDVRYTVERINSVDYVTADQFQQGMQQAATEGAMRGEQRALSTLRQNTTQRRKIGL